MYDPTREQKPFEIKLGSKCINIYTMPIKATILYDEYTKETARILSTYATMQNLVKTEESLPEGQEKTDFINAHKKELDDFVVVINTFTSKKEKIINDILKAILFAADEPFDKDEWDSLYSVNDKFQIVNAFVDSKKKALLEGMKEKGL